MVGNHYTMSSDKVGFSQENPIVSSCVSFSTETLPSVLEALESAEKKINSVKNRWNSLWSTEVDSRNIFCIDAYATASQVLQNN